MTTQTTSASETAAEIDQLTKSMSGLNDMSGAFSKSITTAFSQAVVQGKSLDTVLQNVAKTVSNSALKQALNPISSSIGGTINSAMQGLTTSLTGAFSSLFGFRSGGVFQGGRVSPFADGGVVSSPTYFPMSGGATGLMGEAGAEAIMPLQRAPDGRLGVAGGGGPAPMNVTFNVTTPDTAGFAQSQTQITSMLARAVARGQRGL
jgi:lambda family phage tail tape measure protein